MPERIKLIWDFRGPNSDHIAKHHAKHLAEFVTMEGLQNTVCGNETITDMHTTAFLVVEKEYMDTLRATLKPHRGQRYQET